MTFKKMQTGPRSNENATQHRMRHTSRMTQVMTASLPCSRATICIRTRNENGHRGLKPMQVQKSPHGVRLCHPAGQGVKQRIDTNGKNDDLD